MNNYNKTQWIKNETLVSADNLNKIENQLDSLTVNVTNNLNSLNSLNNQLDEHLTNINNLQSDIDSLSNDIIDVNNNIASINNNINTINEDIINLDNSLSNDIDIINSNIIDINDNITAINESFNSQIEDINNEINDLKEFNNTIIGTTSDNDAITIRDSIPSGFIELGELDFDYMLNHENEVKLKSTSIAYINGYRIEIPKDTIINIGKAPEKDSREDLLFLEAWKDETYPKTGKLAWRIRHVADVDFNRNYDGLNYFADSSGKNYPSKAKPQGGNLEPISKDNNDYGCNFFKSSYISPKNYYVPGREAINDDIGLYVAGDGADSRKELFNTLDGYVYAIPMFRLYRKPSCGKAIPFEYSKFNPKCDYNKFSKLMKEDKVERVINENIKGRSLVNLAYQTSITLTKNLYTPLTYDGLIKSNKEYTLSFNISKITGSATGKFLRLIIRFTEGSDDTSSDVNINVTSSSFTTGKVKVKIPSQTDSIAKLYIHLSGGTDGDSIALTDVMILEDDWTNKEIPEFFTGLKSLGEDDNNLLAIKNGILDKDTYDINDGNQKLNTFEDVTYVSSDNTIKPIVEAVIKNGEEETLLESLNTKLETTGEEIIEFAKIKGKTIQNLIKNTSWIVVPENSLAYMEIDWSLLKPSTNYTYIVLNPSQKINLNNAYIGNNFTNASDLNISSPILVTTTQNILENNIGGMFNPHLYSLGDILDDNDFANTKIMLLEGDYTNIHLEDIPFVEGIKSVGEDEENKISLKSNNRNLISKDMYTNTWFQSLQGDYELDLNDNTEKKYSIYNIKTYGLTNLKLICNKEFNRLSYRGKDINNNILYKGELGAVKLTEYIFSDIPENIVTLDLYVNSFGIDDSYDFMLKEIDDNDNYIKYKSSIQNIYLKESLRSLPNGTCDEIVGNKIIRRVGKFIINPNDLIVRVTGVSDKKRWVIKTDKSIANISGRVISCLSNKFPSVTALNTWDEFIDGIAQNNSDNTIYLYLERYSDGSEESKQALINELGNDTVVYYELANPIEEYIEQVYDKESIKTYQLDVPLRSLPNGIKDEIKDGILIRRLGENLLNNETEYEWGNDNSNNYVYIKNFNKIIKSNSTLISDKLPYYKGMSQLGINYLTISSASVIVFMFDTPVNTLAEGIAKAKSLIGNSGMKIIYELANPIEIPLKEINPQSIDYSLNRQFKEGNYLRELPNGVKDTIENGKVIRKTKKIILSGSEDWWGYQPHETGLKRVIITLNDLKLGSSVLCREFKNILWNDNAWESTVPIVSVLNSHNHMYFFVNNINSIDDWIARLEQSPIEIIYELDNPIEEELTSENCNYYPYHDFNSYCGSIYLGNGKNYIVNDNKLSTEDSIIAESDFREIENSLNIEDCRYKKSEEGYENLYFKPIGNNLALLKNLIHASLTEASGNIWTQKGDIKHDSFGNISWYNDDVYEWSDIGIILEVKANSKYTFSVNMIDNNNSPYNLVVAEYSKKPIINVGEANTATYLGVQKLGSQSSTGLKTFTFITNVNTKYIYCCISMKMPYAIYKFNDFMINEGRPINFELGIGQCIAFENIEENDIDDLRHQVSLTGFNYSEILEKNFNLLLQGEL